MDGEDIETCRWVGPGLSLMVRVALSPEWSQSHCDSTEVILRSTEMLVCWILETWGRGKLPSSRCMSLCAQEPLQEQRLMVLEGSPGLGKKLLREAD